jgi:hypothetical protein
MGVGRSLAYSSTLFYEKKGFLSHRHIMSGDDDLFVNSAATADNTAVYLHPQSFVYSEPKITWADWWIQKTRHLSTGKFYKTKHQVALGVFTFSHFCFYVFWAASLVGAFSYMKPFIGSVNMGVCVISLFLLRWLIIWIIFGFVCAKLNAKKLIGWIPVFDIIWLFYYIIMSQTIFLKKKIKQWK